jgi:hypothetical protein
VNPIAPLAAAAKIHDSVLVHCDGLDRFTHWLDKFEKPFIMIQKHRIDQP